MSAVVQPSVTTAVPGPATASALRELNEVYDVRAAQLVVDYERSHGNL